MCAGSHDTFEIFVWSMQTGRLLEVAGNLLGICWEFAGNLLGIC